MTHEINTREAPTPSSKIIDPKLAPACLDHNNLSLCWWKTCRVITYFQKVWQIGTVGSWWNFASFQFYCSFQYLFSWYIWFQLFFGGSKVELRLVWRFFGNNMVEDRSSLTAHILFDKFICMVSSCRVWRYPIWLYHKNKLAVWC
jgi:hypothetical protein